ncbi:MAG: hypothetical protein K5838_07890 [Elusimicrobiales bacterium]|nr:hypothetical protein [Elusimicrobiales bacterium]
MNKNSECEDNCGENLKRETQNESFLEAAAKRLNKKFPGGFNESGLAIINSIYRSLIGRRGLRSMARTSSLRAFRGDFYRYFGEAAQECHDEFPDEYSSLFGNKGKYYETMLIMADMIYKELTQGK